MKAPNKIYVEVCEDGIFAFPKPPFKESVEYIRADLVDSLQHEQPEMDLEKEIEKEWVEFGKYNYAVFKRLLRKYYKLGRKGGKV